jgi:23S rRNA (adenine2503-C2)-methyltransferase
MAPSLHESGALEAFRREFGFDPDRVRLFRNALYKGGIPLLEAAALLPPEVQGAFRERFGSAVLTLEERRDSERDGASKLIFRTEAGLLFETVLLRIRSGRTSVCVSSQVGCAAKCTFCATGQMKIARSLSASEIVEQVVLARQMLGAEGRKLRNVVFMGMGEPLHNRAAVTEAIERLRDPRWFDLSENHLLVSTVGVAHELLAFAEAMPRVHLALSLHAARQNVREALMPLAKQTPVSELRRLLIEVEAIRKKTMMLEVLLLRDVNDTEEDIEALIEFCRGLDVHVNLIPYNPVAGALGQSGAPLSGTGPERRREVSERLKAAGLRVTTRVSLGDDIAAACGQLVKQHDVRPARRDGRSP